MGIDETKLTIGAQSPFLPGTNIQFAWDSTSLGMLKTCPRLYQLTMIDGWAPKGESVHLRFGQEYHTALETYDYVRATGEEHPTAVRMAIQRALINTTGWVVDQDTKAGKYKNRNTLIQLVVDYLDHFADDPAATVILSNGKPAVELSFRFELDFGPQASNEEEAICRAREQGNFGEVSHIGQPYLLCGHLDKVVEFNGQLLVADHKTTTSTLSSSYFRQYEPNNQMTLYTIAGKVVMDSVIKGIMIDAAQIMLDNPSRFVRGFTYRTSDQLEEWVHDLRIFLDQAESYAVAEYWPMNDTACDKFGGCRFREICSASPSVRDRFLAGSFEKLEPDARWNPLRSR